MRKKNEQFTGLTSLKNYHERKCWRMRCKPSSYWGDLAFSKASGQLVWIAQHYFDPDRKACWKTTDVRCAVLGGHVTDCSQTPLATPAVKLLSASSEAMFCNIAPSTFVTVKVLLRVKLSNPSNLSSNSVTWSFRNSIKRAKGAQTRHSKTSSSTERTRCFLVVYVWSLLDVSQT